MTWRACPICGGCPKWGGGERVTCEGCGWTVTRGSGRPPSRAWDEDSAALAGLMARHGWAKGAPKRGKGRPRTFDPHFITPHLEGREVRARDLAVELGISESTVRRALVALRDTGEVESTGGRWRMTG